jgi:hypothetical protein
MSENSSTNLPKWPFLAGDAVLVILACFIVIASPKPMAALNIFACILSVILGMMIYVTPYLIEHLTSQQLLKLKQAKAEETLLKAVELASDLLKRTEAIHAETMNAVLKVKQVPSLLEDKAEELLQILESEKLTSNISELEDLLTRLESIPSGSTPVQNSSELSSINKQLVKLLDTQKSTASNSKEALETTMEALRNEMLECFSRLETSKSNIEDIDNAESPTDRNIDKTEITSTLEAIEEVEEEFSETKNDVEDIQDIELPISNNVPEQITISNPADKFPNDAKIISNADGATRLLIGAFIGISNKLYIRGDGPGLSLDKGIPMELVGIGKWEWKTYDASSTIRCKVLINDEQWTDSVDIDIEPNTTVETTASF